MGHDFHFLSRLERIDGPALDLALGLYRDPKLLRWALTTLPTSDAPVVALPLSPAAEPPYALVSRKGKFITCLGEGMQPGGTEVIRWEQLDGVQGEWRNITAFLAKGKNRGGEVLKRVLSTGPWLKREDFLDLQVIAGLRHKPVADILATGVETWLGLRDRTRARDFQRLDHERRHRLSAAWKAVWGGTHGYIALIEATYQALTLRSATLDPDHFIEMAGLVAESGFDGMLLRAAWGLARLGPPMLDALTQAINRGIEGIEGFRRGQPPDADTMVTTGMLFSCIFALVGLASNHPTCRAAALECLRGHTGIIATPGTDSAALLEIVQSSIELLEAPDAGHTRSRQVVAQHACAAFGVESVDHLDPTTLHLPSLASVGQFYFQPAHLSAAIGLMPTLGALPAEALFASAEWLANTPRPTISLEQVRDMLVSDAAAFTEMIRYRAALSVPKAGRNEVCPCGSGRKYKKCCGK